MIDSSVFLEVIWAIVKLISLFYIVGLLFNFVICRKVYYGHIATYYYLISGILLIVSVFAIVQTKAFSILLPIPLLLLLLSLVVNKRLFINQSQSTLQQKIAPFLFLFFSLSLYLGYYLQCFNVEGGIIHYLTGDQEFYTRVAENLNTFGIENLRVEYLYPKRFGTEPYHYGDIWTIAFGMKFIHLKPIFVASLIIAPILLSVFSLGILAIAIHFIPNKYLGLASILVAFAGFVGGFSIFFPGFVFPNQVDIYSFSLCHYTKLFWWASLLPILLLLIYYKLDRYIVYPLFIIGLGYISVFPSIVLAATLWLLIIALRKRPVYIALFTVVSILVLIFLYLLYVYYPSTLPEVSKLSAKANFKISSVFENFRTSVNIFVGGGLQFLVYLPMIVMLFFLNYKNKDFSKSNIFNVIIFLVLFSFSSLLVWAILFTTTFESIQFFYNVFVVAMGSASLITYLYVFANVSSIWLKFISIFFFFFAIYPNRRYDITMTTIPVAEWSSIKQFITKSSRPKFAHYRNEDDYSNDIFGSSTVIAMPLSVLAYAIDNYQNYSLNAPFTVLDTSKKEYVYQKNNIEWSPMAYFVKLPQNNGLSKDSLMLKFISENKIDFICTPIKAQLPFSLKELAVDSLYAPATAWKIYYCPNKTKM